MYLMWQQHHPSQLFRPKKSAGVVILFYCTTETVVVNFGTGGSCEGKYADREEDGKFDGRGVPKTDSEESDSSSKNRQA